MERAGAKRYETLTDWLRAQAGGILTPLAQWLGKLGFHPNTITLLGLGLAVAVAAVIASGRLTLAGVLLILTSWMDALDGALARATNSKSRFGAFLDSTLDRLSEGALLCGLLVWALPRSSALEIYLIFGVLLGSVMVSYTRARAEGVGYQCKVGLFTRVERVLVLALGLLLNWIRPMLIVMAVLTWITVIQRVWFVYRESRQDP